MRYTLYRREKVPHDVLCLGCSDAEPVDLLSLASHLASSFIPNAVIIDATAAEEPPAHYVEVGLNPKACRALTPYIVKL